ncbi:MAG: GAF domain-containing protein [bacterium]|nr:GAF domain-containing protein [bacterium]
MYSDVSNIRESDEMHVSSGTCLEILAAVEQISALPDTERIMAVLQEWIQRLTRASGVSLYRIDHRGVIENISRWGETPKSGDMVSLDVVVGGLTRGYVHIYIPGGTKRIDPQASDILMSLVRQAFRALDNIALLESCEQRLNELNTIYEASRVVSASPDLDKVVSFLMGLAGKILNCDSGLALLLDEQQRRLTLEYVQGEAASCCSGMEDLLGEDLYRLVEEVSCPSVHDAVNPDDSFGILHQVYPWLNSYVVLPLRAEGRNIGLLILASSTAVEYPPELVRLLTILSAQAAVILKNALSYKRAVEQKTLELSTLYYASARLSSASNAEEANHVILDIISGVVKYDESFIYVYDDINERLALNASRTAAEPPARIIDCADCDNVYAWAFHEGKAVIFSDSAREKLFRNLAEERGMRSAIVIPLVVEHRAVGILAVQSRTAGAYTEDHARMLSIIASQAAATYKSLEVLNTLTSYTVNILRSIASGVVTVDTDGRISLWNAAMEKFTRMGRRKVLGGSLKEVMAGIDAEACRRIDEVKRQVMRYGRTVRGYEISLPGRKGELTFNLNCSRLRSSSGEILGAVLVFEDITERKAIEGQVRRVSQLAAIGQLAANVAHEIRNPLSSIKGAAQYLQSELGEQSALSEFSAIISQETDRLNRVVTDFLTFARPNPPKLRRHDLNEVLRRSLELLNVEMEQSGIRAKVRLSGKLPDIYMDSDHLEQVFLNLLINALQAMQNGGTLSVSSALTRDREETGGGGYVRVDIADSGCGIARDDLDKIFVPFFTTKNGGSGLGLSIVHQIVESHGGFIRISSRPGHGSVFSIYIPCRTREEAEELMRSCRDVGSPQLIR